MSTLTQFFGGGSTTQVVNFYSSGGVVSGANLVATSANMAREVLSGALTAGALTTLLTVTGSGRVPLLMAFSKNSTSRTIRLVVEVDGVSVFDATTSVFAGTSSGLVAAGQGNPPVPSEPIRFSSSLVVRVASSLTETDNVAIAYVLHST
jgi:hypothetical protein